MAEKQVATIKDVSLSDLAVAYASGVPARCTFTHSDDYVEHNRNLKVRGLERDKKEGWYLVKGELEYDTCRPGQDAGAKFVWSRVEIRYNQFEKEGKVLFK